MKNLVRGGMVLFASILIVAFIYGQSRNETVLALANDSQTTIENNTSYNNSIQQQTDEKKLVKTTASVKKAGAGASRGGFTATAYCLSGKTAMGHGVRRGLVAADPRILRLGSRITITAGPWSGTYLVSDTGGAIKGKRLDIWVPGCAEARRFGRRTVQVFVAE
jgi:3D (Asp-Asp-Asp) domain-containing protein